MSPFNPRKGCLISLYHENDDVDDVRRTQEGFNDIVITIVKFNVLLRQQKLHTKYFWMAITYSFILPVRLTFPCVTGLVLVNIRRCREPSSLAVYN